MKNKSGGVDNINAKTLKILSEHISVPLEYIFNLCMEKSIWPDALKNAEKSLSTKLVKNLINNYRPISLISNIVKISEKIIYNRLYQFFENDNIMSEKQYGFVKNTGTTDALNYISKIIYKNLDISKPIIVAFLDLAKVFDTVNHRVLLDKLE